MNRSSGVSIKLETDLRITASSFGEYALLHQIRLTVFRKITLYELKNWEIWIVMRGKLCYTRFVARTVLLIG